MSEIFWAARVEGFGPPEGVQFVFGHSNERSSYAIGWIDRKLVIHDFEDVPLGDEVDQRLVARAEAVGALCVLNSLVVAARRLGASFPVDRQEAS